LPEALAGELSLEGPSGAGWSSGFPKIAGEIHVPIGGSCGAPSNSGVGPAAVTFSRAGGYRFDSRKMAYSRRLLQYSLVSGVSATKPFKLCILAEMRP
jgi:hypothetical protein